MLGSRKKHGVYFLVGLCAVLISSMSFAIELQCPASVEVSEKLINEPMSWEGLIDQSRGGHHLESVGFYVGHPKNKGGVVPDNTARSKDLAKTTWRFPEKKSDDFWIGCTYANTNAMLTQQLPNGLSYCEATSELLPSGSKLRIKSVVCR
jgi:hypothetical protein